MLWCEQAWVKPNTLTSTLLTMWFSSRSCGASLNRHCSFFRKRRLNLDYKSTGIKPRFSPSATFCQSPPDLFINDTRVESVDSFVYLGVLVNGSCTSSDEISRCLALAQSAFGQLRDNFWWSCLKEKTKIQLYGTYILPILLYGSETSPQTSWSCG